MLLTLIARKYNQDKFGNNNNGPHLNSLTVPEYIGGFILLVICIFAVITAVKCNPNNKFWMGLLAAIFSEILFIIQFAIKKYALKDPNYCKGFVVR